MDIMTNAAVDAALADREGWVRDGDAIVRRLRFPSFLDAIAFIGRLGPVAESADHHPELTNVYRDVTVRLTTHEAGGITSRDLDLAHAIDAVVGPGVEG
jgi:4a-hydroxytetrahydrobiopterin dehydratase